LHGIDRIVEACEKHGKAAATLSGDVETAQQSMDRGFRMLSYGYDIGLLQNSLTMGIDACRDYKERYGMDGKRKRMEKSQSGGGRQGGSSGRY